MNLISRDYLFSTAANKLQYALTNPITDGPFPDRYWLVRYLTIWINDSGAENPELYLVSSGAYVQLQQQIANLGGGYKPDYTAGGAAGSPPIAGIHKLGGGGGLFGSFQFSTAQGSVGLGGCCPNNTGYTEFLIPGGWALYCVEVTGSGAASPRSILMRLAYNEILNGCNPDASW